MLVVQVARAEVLQHLLLVPIRFSAAYLIENMDSPDHFAKIVVAIFAKKLWVR